MGTGRLPDTSTQVLWWCPPGQHIPSASGVLREVERDEQWLSERPDVLSPAGIDAIGADHRNGSYPNGGRTMLMIGSRTEQSVGSTKNHFIGNVEIGWVI
jgi:hypothetical protein